MGDLMILLLCIWGAGGLGFFCWLEDQDITAIRKLAYPLIFMLVGPIVWFIAVVFGILVSIDWFHKKIGKPLEKVIFKREWWE